MDKLYQLIFFLGIGFLAIVITVFVLAVSLLGRAIILSTEEQAKLEEKAKNENENEIKSLQEKLNEARRTSRVDIGSLQQSLRDLEAKDSKHRRKLNWIRMKPKLLTATWGALIPAAFFIVSIIFSGLGLNIFISIFTLVIGIVFVCLTLKVVEGVAVTSEEVASIKQIEIFKTALIEFEEQKKPKLDFTFRDVEPPFHAKVGEQITIHFYIGLLQGDIAKRLKTLFLAPPDFEFINQNTWIQGKDKNLVAGYITTEVNSTECRHGILTPAKLIIKVPTTKGTYTIYYRITCEGFDSGRKSFEIIVE